MRFGLYKIHRNGTTTLSGRARYKTEKAAIDTAVRWLQYRHEEPRVTVSVDGETLVIPARFLSNQNV